MKKKKLFPYLKSKLLVQIIVSLSLYSLFIAFGVIVVVTVLNREAVKAKEAALYTGLLNTTAAYTDMSLHFLSADTKQLTANQDMATLVYQITSRPDRVFLALMSACSYNKLVEDIVLYVPADHFVITSRNKGLPLHESPYEELILQYGSGQLDTSEFFADSHMMKIAQYGSQLWLIREFPLSAPASLATLYYKLDTDSLYRSIGGKSNEYLHTLCVLDPNGKFLFGHTPTEDLDGILDSLLQDPENRQFGRTVYYHTQSETTGWHFLCKTESTPLLAQLADLSVIFILIIAAILLISILLASFLANNFVFPVRKLVSKVNVPSAPFSDYDDQNELNFLQQIIPSIIHSRNILDKTMNELLPDVTSRFLQDLLCGKITNIDHAQRMLTVTRLPFLVRGHYIAAAVSLDENSAEVTPAVIELLILTALQEQKPGLPGIHYCVQWLDALNCIAILVGASESFSQEEARLGWLPMRNALLSSLSQYQSYLLWGETAVTGEILELAFTIEEVMLNLCSLDQVESTPPHVENIGSYDYFYVRVNKAISLLATDEKPEALQILSACIDAIHGAPYETDRKLQMLALLEQALRDRTCEELPRQPEFLMRHCYTYDPALSPEENYQKNSSALSHYYQEIVTHMKNYHLKRRHKSVLAAQEYIKQHTDDPSLSLDLVASAIKINPNYLSKLFNNNLDISFIDYLNSIRIQRACELLRTTDNSAKNVSAMVGFRSQQNFFRVFKKHTGLTPGEFKASLKKL